MTDPAVARAAEHAALAALLWQNVDLVTRALRGEAGPASPLSALIAARTAAEVVQDVTRALAGDARRAGHTWAEIGQLLRISRQAAQQRFAEPPTDSADERSAVPGRRAVQIVEQLRDGDLAGLVLDWDDQMREKLTADQLSKVWQRVGVNAGALQAIGRPSVVHSGPYRIVDVPLAFEFGPMRARITFNRDDTIAGLFILAPQAPEIE